MATSQAGEALGTNFGSDEFPVQWEEGQKELFWVHDDLHIPNPVSPHVRRHRRLVAQVRLHVPPLRDAVRRRTGSPRSSTATSTPRPSPRDRAIRAEATEYGSRSTPRACRWTPSTPAEIGAYLGWTLPYYAENFLDWWRDRLRPEMSATSSASTATTTTRRAWSSSRSCSRTPSTCTTGTGRSTGCSTSPSSPRRRRSTPPIAEVQGRGRPLGADGPAAVLDVENRNWDSDRGALEDQGGDQGATGEVARAFEPANRRRRPRGAGGHRGRPALRRRAHRAVPAGLRLQVDVRPRVLVQDLARGPGADHRGHPRLPGDRLRLPGRASGRRRRPRDREGRGVRGRRGRAAARSSSGRST